ncbi:MAG: hypothetical protein AB7J35_19285 [Dehalococcoidia bacterium]
MRTRLALVAGAGICALTVGAAAFAGGDHGKEREHSDKAHSNQDFGIVQPIDSSSQNSIDAATANSDPRKLATFAKQLKAKVVATVDGAPNIDMMALWPNDQNPQWLIACNEEGPAQVGLLRVRLSDGLSEAIVSGGLSSCDPVHATPWGTIVFGEEAGSSGRMFELISPLNTTGVTVNPDGSTSGGTGAANIVWRSAMGKLSFEGVGIYPNGVAYYGDENRPGTGTPGGAYFKFVPTVLRNPAAGPVASLAESPLAAGSVYGLRLGLRSGATDYGQGTETGRGTWVLAANTPGVNLRAAAATLKLTGYYRPEDLAIDQVALAAGNVRWCGNNTGNEIDDRSYGNTICLTDGTLAAAGALASTPEVQLLAVGNPEMAMMDNIAYQPGRANWIIHEDGDQLLGNNDLWDCMDDGMDDDLLGDACIRIGTLNDLNAEWTGGLFSADGKRFFVSVQHNVTGKGVILEVTGWK